ncbi:hypothetical protein BCR36DRAFT_73186 [Piromyces finnis]|uniref:Uncharacterized protein n=1 Tax=Piromyces finnis TaxID=1754191 RepID=A0A1Y1V747_9FUNG|nr:hypothetical protein BCR36DRAFT_73186 [Piromyces finnis]|eukprot:ORX48697.1 hypothetical protein BCR36DRAFT_73186 [Piromyces finnis]
MNNKNMNRLQKLYANQTIPLQAKAMLSPEIPPEKKLSRMMSQNSNNDIATSLNNIIKRKLPNSDEVRNLFNGQNNLYQNNMLSNTAAAAAATQNLPMGGTNENWNEMNLPNQQYQQNIQSLNSLVMNNSGSMNSINDMSNLQNNILNNMNRANNNIQMNNNAGNQYNTAASNYNNLQRLHGINTNMNGNANNINYVNSMISPELEYQNSVQQQYQNYTFTPRQQQAFMNTNQHPQQQQQQQQQQQLYQRMNNANAANSQQQQQQLPGDFFGQMLHQKQNGNYYIVFIFLLHQK